VRSAAAFAIVAPLAGLLVDAAGPGAVFALVSLLWLPVALVYRRLGRPQRAVADGG
jgi:hypothetical protein